MSSPAEKPEEPESSSQVAESSSSEAPVASGEASSTSQPTSTGPEPTQSPPPTSPASLVGIDLDTIGRAEARKIMSEEHKALGFRPPHGSLAAEAQAAAAKHPEVTGVQKPTLEKLKAAARLDATRILGERSTEAGPSSGTRVAETTSLPKTSPVPEIDLNAISAADARRLMSHEHRALGYRPPPGSLAAEAQAAAAKHRAASGETPSHIKISDETLRAAAYRDAERIKGVREVEGSSKPTGGKEEPREPSPPPSTEPSTSVTEESTPTPRVSTPSVGSGGSAPPMVRAQTDDSVEIILG